MSVCWLSAHVPPTLNPTPAGDSIYKTLAFLFHDWSFGYIPTVVLSSNLNGPFSEINPNKLEHPGPPLNQTTTGSVAGLAKLSTKI